MRALGKLLTTAKKPTAEELEIEQQKKQDYQIARNIAKQNEFESQLSAECVWENSVLRVSAAGPILSKLGDEDCLQGARDTLQGNVITKVLLN